MKTLIKTCAWFGGVAIGWEIGDWILGWFFDDPERAVDWADAACHYSQNPTDSNFSCFISNLALVSAPGIASAILFGFAFFQLALYAIGEKERKSNNPKATPPPNGSNRVVR